MNQPTPEMLELLTNPRFAEALGICLEEEELIQNYERLYGVKRPPERLTPIEMMVDKATGFREHQWREFFRGYLKFVYDCVWIRWPERNNEEC